MNQSKLIAITGGIGTGKSLVTSYLRQKGYSVIDFDEISRGIYLRGKEAFKEVVLEFGEDLLKADGEIDRKKLAEIVFSDRSRLDCLNSITHKHIFKEARHLIEGLEDELIFLDVPLLYEVREKISRSGIDIDEVWLVYSQRETQIRRVMDRDKVSQSEAIRRVDAQIPTDKKLEFADKIICNTDDVSSLYAQVDRLLDGN